MQALWSRAARNPGTCNCIQCFSSTTAVARRIGPISLRGSWVLGSPTSTFVYTAIFAAGIAIDVNGKQARNKQWDVAFSHLREELAKTEEAKLSLIKDNAPPPDLDRRRQKHFHVELESLANLDFVPLGDVWPEGIDWTSIHRVAGMDLIEDPVLLEQQSLVQVDGEVTERLWKLIPFDSGLPGTQALAWPANTGSELKRTNLPPQSLWSLDSLRRKALRKRYSWKKVATQELSMGWLIHRLTSQAQCRNLSWLDFDTLSKPLHAIAFLSELASQQIRQKIADRLKIIATLPAQLSSDEIAEARAHNIPSHFPQYRQDDDGDFLDTANAMNAALKDLLGAKISDDQNQVATTIAKVCHNLLISSAPPDVQTFNILLTGLKRWNLHHMTEAVIRSFYYCKIRPNEITCATILDHYIRVNNPEEFSKFVALMRGVGGALMLARPDIIVNEASEGRVVRIDENIVRQKVHPSPMVFNMLMLGALRFAGFDRAMEIYYEMKEDGWGLDVLGLNNFLADCVARGDWDGGLYVWEEVKKVRSQPEDSHWKRIYATMLSLASSTGNGLPFQQILKEVEARRFNAREVLELAKEILAEIKDRRAPSFWAGDHVMMALLNYRQDVNASDDAPPDVVAADPG